MQFFKNTDYRDILKLEFQRRTSINPAYSMRAYARDLKLAPSSLSEVLRHKQGLSIVKAHTISEVLGLNDLEKDYFVGLVQSKHDRCTAKRKHAAIKVETLARNYNQEAVLEQSKFDVISDWWNFAILELVKTKGFKGNIDWIAESLKINTSTVKYSLEKLLECGLIKSFRNTFKAEKKLFSIKSQVPSATIRSFHAQAMEKAKHALYNQPVNEREFSTMVISMNDEKYEEAKKLIFEFNRKFNDLMANVPREEKNRVYILSNQFYPISEKQ